MASVQAVSANNPERDPLEQRRRRAVRTAVIAALVAVGFYVGFFLFMHWAHR